MTLLQAHAEAEYGIIPASLPAPPRVAAAAGASYVLGATIPLLAMAVIPGPSRALVTFIIVLLALALTGWVSARISDVHPAVPIARTAGIGALAMAITYVIGRVSSGSDSPLATPVDGLDQDHPVSNSVTVVPMFSSRLGALVRRRVRSPGRSSGGPALAAASPPVFVSAPSACGGCRRALDTFLVEAGAVR